MKNARRISLLLCCAVAVAVAFIATGCQEQPKKPQVTLQIMSTPQWKGVLAETESNADYADFLTYAAEKFVQQYEPADVNFTVEIVSYEERRAKMFDSYGTAAAPDVCFEGLFNFNDSIHQGCVLPLDDIIDNAARADLDEVIWNSATFAEQIYFYPYMGMPVQLVYRPDLFRAAGLEEYISDANTIAHWSVDDLNLILDSLAKSLPQGSYPMSLFAANEQADTYTMLLLRMFGCPFLEETTAVLNTEEGIAALQWLHDGLAKGYFPPNAAEMTQKDCCKLLLEGKIAINFTTSGLYSWRQNEGYGENLRLANFPNRSQDMINANYFTGFVAMNSGDPARMQVAKDFIRFVCTDAELLQSSVNNLPIHKSVLAENALTLPLFQTYSDNLQYMIDFTDGIPGYTALRQIFYPLMQQFFSGELSAQQTAEIFDARANNLIQNQKASSVIYK